MPKEGNRLKRQSAEDYVVDLIKEQLEDSRMRLNKQKLFSGGYQSAAETLRNNVGINSIQEIIDNVESKAEQ